MNERHQQACDTLGFGYKRTVKIRKGLTFDDVLLEPAYSVIKPSEADVSTRLTKELMLKVPVISAAMDTVTGIEMAVALLEYGAAATIHKNCTIGEQLNMISVSLRNAVRLEGKIGGAVGVGPGELERALSLFGAGADYVVVDTAHGDSKAVVDQVAAIKNRDDKFQVIAGNVTTASAVHRLISAGADAIKLGQGSGAICTTRVVAGIGVPQLQAILDCFDMAETYGVPLIADGGIRGSGDIVKALAAGASTVMLGKLLAQTTEALGKGTYRGMGSIDAMKAGSADRYGQDKTDKMTPEGVVGTVDTIGSVKDVLDRLVGGIKSGMGYQGVTTIKQLSEEPVFIKITNAGLIESHPHGLKTYKT